MALVADGLLHLYNLLLDSRDPRTSYWIFVDPVTFLGIVVFYLLFCLLIGPWFMKNRPPYDLRRSISAYNAFQVLLNLYLFSEGYYLMFLNDFDFLCQTVDFSDNYLAVRVASGCWWFLFSRMIDMLDTVFFVLRKKDSNVSFLHVYHHVLVTFVTWLLVIYQPGGNCIIVGFLNCFVHMLMYSYYFITSLGPEYKRFVWWKKYLTQLQIVQFLIAAGHALQALFRDCAFSKVFTSVFLVNELLLFYLFCQFYIRAYLRPKSFNKRN